MRLVGATRTQVSVLAAVESTAAALLGVAAGFAVFFGLRIPVAGIPFVGQPFFPGELTLSLSDVIVVAIGVPIFAAVAARLALRRVNISPLGVTRRVTPKPPGAWRVVPLLLGLAELGFWEARGHPASIQGQIQAFVTSFALIIIGLFIAGPWLTMAAARRMARWTSRPGTLIAARRIGDDPRAAFRSVSGLVLALLVTTVATIAITTQDAKDPTRFGSIAESHVLTAQISESSAAARNGGLGMRSGIADPGPAAPGRAARRPAECGARRPGGARGARGPRADDPWPFREPRRQRVRRQRRRQRHPDPGRRGLVRAARDRARARPLPGRRGNGRVPGGRLQRSPRLQLERGHLHLAGR